MRSSKVPAAWSSRPPRARLHLVGLVDRTLHGLADVSHVVSDPRCRLGDVHLRLGGGVLGLDDFFLGPELLDLRLKLLLGLRSTCPALTRAR